MKFFVVSAITIVVLVFYGHFLRDALNSANYGVVFLCFVVTLYLGWFLQTPIEKRDALRTFKVWGWRWRRWLR